MTDRPQTEDNGAGCAFVLGVIILGIAIGNILGAAYGWALIGTSLFIIGLLGTMHR